MIEKVTSKLIQDKNKELDKYSKNLIRFNDEINNVKTERKRKINTQKELQNLNDTLNRKGAQSLHTVNNSSTVNAFSSSNFNTNFHRDASINNRLRVESNYTTRSGGDRIIDAS